MLVFLYRIDAGNVRFRHEVGRKDFIRTDQIHRAITLNQIFIVPTMKHMYNVYSKPTLSVTHQFFSVGN